MMRNLIQRLLLCLCFFLGSSYAADKVLIERYEAWEHPVLAVFKKYEISLYKVSYSQDGTCPTFYAKLKYCPDPHAPVSQIYYDKIYYEILKANSFFPYALVSELDNLRINVGWADKKKEHLFIRLEKANTPSLCKDGTMNPDDEPFVVSSELKQQLKSSPH